MANFISLYQTDLSHVDESEHQVFQQLKDCLAPLSGWYLRWGFYYKANGKVTSEADFFIADPQGRIVVLEVKGYIPAVGTQKPIDQLLAQRSAIVSLLAEVALPSTQTAWVHIALGLPNIPRARVVFLEGIDRQNHLFGDDLASPESFLAWWDKLWADPNLRGYPDHVSKLWAQQFSAPPGTFFFRLDQAHLNDCLHRKNFLLTALEDNPCLLVTGGAGSGKTWYATEYILRQLAAPGERRVLFLVYNLLLATQLQSALANRLRKEKDQLARLRILAWEELLAELYTDCGETRPAISKDREQGKKDYAAQAARLPDLAARAAAAHPAKWGFDVLVVDEVQDHDTHYTAGDSTGGWWSAYRHLLKDWNTARIALFGDPAQRLHLRDPALFSPQSLLAQFTQTPVRVTLPQNLRFTRHIHAHLRTELVCPETQTLVAGLAGEAPLIDGPPVETYTATAAGCQQQVSAILARWQVEHGCLPRQVLLVSACSNPQSNPRSAFNQATGIQVTLGPTSIKTYPLRSNALPDRKTPDVITLASVNRIKGLERPGVIIVDVAAWGDRTQTAPTPEAAAERQALWLAASRAQQLLAIIYQPTVPASALPAPQSQP